MKLLTSDFDVFGDGSVALVSTPGHRHCWCSSEHRWIVLTGDAAHFKDNGVTIAR